jgi:outer membrane protein OmpA-like peptidoglycan-associated protein
MRITPPDLLAITLLVSALAGTAVPASAQFGRLGERAKQRVERKVGQKVDEKVDKAVDRVMDGAEAKATGNEGPAAGAQVQADGVAASGAGSPKLQPGQGAWANYDFVPGERILFAEDFANDRVGNFPRRLKFHRGTLEVVEWRGKRWLRTADHNGGVFSITLPEALPARFTMEFDLTLPSDWCSGIYFGEVDGNKAMQSGASCRADGSYIRVAGGQVGLAREVEFIARRQVQDLLEDERWTEPFRVRLHVDGDYAKLYVNETRVANVPSIQIARTNQVFFLLQGGGKDAPVIVGDISINAGGGSLYDALAADGRVATQGILFDTGSDRIRPESTPTLKEIGGMLEQHADLKLTIEGHTDNVGQAAANQTLSEKRAAAVVAHLVQQGIGASRLEAKGYGDTQPAASNDTPEGRQQNRRVELVRK